MQLRGGPCNVHRQTMTKNSLIIFPSVIASQIVKEALIASDASPATILARSMHPQSDFQQRLQLQQQTRP
jgi:hypothetical protein